MQRAVTETREGVPIPKLIDPSQAQVPLRGRAGTPPVARGRAIPRTTP